MPRLNVVRESKIHRSGRVRQLEGLFDVPEASQTRKEWACDIPIEERDWNIGLIVGPSGCGKSTIAKELFGDRLINGFEWPSDRSLVDGFPSQLSINEITALLSSVGFSSPPAWLKPFSVLSNGEQFRVNLARALAESPDLSVIDEFTSVVDRQVAKVGSAAIAKSVRRSNRKFVGVACHYDIIEWLDPDWTFEPDLNRFTWRLERQRPPIEIIVRRVHPASWKLFHPHHYLSASLNKLSTCFCAFIENRPAAFTAVIHAQHPKLGLYYRAHRTVCLPDYQGIGLGSKITEIVASLYRAKGQTLYSTSGHPAVIAHRKNRRDLWKCIRSARWDENDFVQRKKRRSVSKNCMQSPVLRVTASFRYVGPSAESTLADAMLSEKPKFFPMTEEDFRIVNFMRAIRRTNIRTAIQELGLSDSTIQRVFMGLVSIGCVAVSKNRSRKIFEWLGEPQFRH
jgi:energy-coupling factor transporter ATP-binding protein EcfA2